MTFPKPDFSPETIRAAQAHAHAEYPKESCGLIVDGVYIPCENIAADPEKHFRIADEVVLDAGDRLQAVVHSHPDAREDYSPYPSASDMRHQIDMGCIYAIIPCSKVEAKAPLFWGDYRLEEPLIGREFIPGVFDCYTLIRAWYWQQKGVLLPEFPRDHKWWLDNDNEDFYRTRFSDAGFQLITADEAQPGDVFVGKIASPSVPNHGGILLERGLALHHRMGRLSLREPIGPRLPYITHWLRYVGKAE